MKTGSQGTFVISWSQTETDGVKAASLDLLTTGAAWRWTGQAVPVAAAPGPLLLCGAAGEAELRRRAAQMVRRLAGAAIGGGAPPAQGPTAEAAIADQSLVLTDGRRSFELTLIDLPGAGARLAMALGDMPPPDQDLWIVAATIDRRPREPGPRAAGGVICFAPGTAIATLEGPRPIETLRPGAQVLTRDNGPQEILWVGQRRMSGARLYVMPHLRPIRFRTGALGTDEPDRDLVVSPQHRMLVRGAQARALFNTDEVLVEARALVNDRTILVDRALREVTYVHVLLEGHNVIWANGMQCESFHPALADLDLLEPGQRQGLEAVLPGVGANPMDYGAFIRKTLSRSEAAILRHDAGR